MHLKKTILLFTFVTIILSAQEYSFDFEEFKKTPYEHIGIFKMQSDVSKLNNSSNIYKLSFFNKEEKDFWDSHYASLQLRGSYEISKFKFTLDLKDKLSYTSNDEFENDFSIYESFLNSNLSTNFDFQLGKKSVKWGKGYIWNLVSFVGRQKDINDIDAGLEGFWMFKLNYVKSLSGILQNFSISPVIIPVNKEINANFSDDDNINFILNNYFLIADTDFDTYLFYENSEFKKFGADFARNILANWEIHAEYVFEKDVVTNSLNSNFNVGSMVDNSHKYLFGTRILFETNTTVILEYLHNDSGLDKEQMTNFYDAIDSAISGNPALLPIIKDYQFENFTSQFLMKDYLYLKFSHPEPFNVLYFTPSIFVLYNLNDNSKMIGVEFSYSRFNNLNLKLKYNSLSGNLNSEFGGKISSNKLSLLIDYTF
ncbi:MAG: hypothetical protein PF551_06955 [Candidatus Marinimicrobia bacterium]|jgi:hypothetical protein|nr:hypothetical protein [Candidatus Neomarinimicrobiota bacterium]